LVNSATYTQRTSKGEGSKCFFGIPKTNSYKEASKQARLLLPAQVSNSKAKKVTMRGCFPPLMTIPQVEAIAIGF
jgi:hypothetical protein